MSRYSFTVVSVSESEVRADDDVVEDALTKRTELSRLRISGHARP